MQEPRVKSAMTAFPYAIDVIAPIGEARALMLERRVHHLPVTRGDELVGIITDRDIKLILGPELGSPDPKELTVEDAYVSPGYVVDLDVPLQQVLSTMAERHIGAALVTHHGRLAGIFTATDACRVFAAYLQERFHPPAASA
ncbi:MAG: CBS domain-containing protein [Pseudomonadales bacterium]|nr:CBS domain-containing protein [Pseudomonadales bacterium]